MTPSSGKYTERRGEFWTRVQMEINGAYRKHGAEPWGRHEFYAILKEEVDELWDAIKSDAPQQEVEAELVQVAAMCLRYYETGDRYRTLAALSAHHQEKET